MADLNQAVQFVLRQEDSRLSGAVTTLPGDRGGATRFGLASRFHTDLVEQGFYELVDGAPKVSNDDALAIAEKAYESEYAAGLHLDDIKSQDVANRLLSFAINEGPHEAAVLLQRAMGVADDGIIGPATVDAINAADPDAVLAGYRAQEEAFYRHLVAVRPELLPELHGLINRADA